MPSKKALEQDILMVCKQRDSAISKVEKLYRDLDKADSKLDRALEDNHAIREEIKKLIKKIFPSESFLEMFKLS